MVLSVFLMTIQSIQGLSSLLSSWISQGLWFLMGEDFFLLLLLLMFMLLRAGCGKERGDVSKWGDWVFGE